METEPIQSSRYHFVWRWHFYAGLIVSPILLLLAATGGLYLFERELDGLLHPRAAHVASAGAAAVPVSVQEAAVRAAYPGAVIGRYAAPVAAGRAAEWGVSTPTGEGLAVFVDPATARITGVVPDAQRLTHILSTLHGELMLGPLGDWLVELAASWGFILLVSGVYLWWPRPSRKAGVLAPRLGAKGRALWRDLHAVPAFWIAPAIAFLILTGLPWSGVWGGNLAKLGTVEALAPVMAPTPNFTRFPDAPPHHAPSEAALKDHPFAEELPWAVRKAGLPIVLVHAGHDHAVSAPPQARFAVDDLLGMAAARGMTGPGLRIFYPQGETGVFSASFVPDQAQRQRTLHVDPRDGAILADIGWAQYSPLGKAVEFGVMTHLGRQFGLVNQLVLALACLGLIGVIGLGLWMWLRRRPPGKLGAPPASPQRGRAGPVLAIMLALGVAFPLAGASIAALALGDWLWKRARAAR